HRGGGQAGGADAFEGGAARDGAGIRGSRLLAGILHGNIPSVADRTAFCVRREPRSVELAVEIGRGECRGVPSPLVGEGQGGGESQTSKIGSPPTPSPSPQGGGEPHRTRGWESIWSRRSDG